MSLSRRGFIERAAAAGALSGTWAGAQSVPRSGGPNILYIIQEDIGPNHACYGEPLVKTPHVDRLSETRQPCGSGVPDAGKAMARIRRQSTFEADHELTLLAL